MHMGDGGTAGETQSKQGTSHSSKSDPKTRQTRAHSYVRLKMTDEMKQSQLARVGRDRRLTQEADRQTDRQAHTLPYVRWTEIDCRWTLRVESGNDIHMDRRRVLGGRLQWAAGADGPIEDRQACKLLGLQVGRWAGLGKKGPLASMLRAILFRSFRQRKEVWLGICLTDLIGSLERASCSLAANSLALELAQLQCGW